ncbi:MAG: hypothetical protein O7A07_07055 [Acidobacteria bacterium]|nr:hypothetical protein [Acidobacteriota bacterium]
MGFRRYYSAVRVATVASLLSLAAMAGCTQGSTPGDRGPLFVAGFENATGDEAFRFWDPWLSDMLIRDLWQAESPVVWPLARTLRVRAGAGDPGKDAVLAAGRQDGAGVVLFGRVSREGDGFLLSAEMISTTGGESFGILSESAVAAQEIPAAVDRLRDAIWGALGVEGPAEPAAIMSLTTSNLNAYGEFVAGEVLFYQQRYLAAQDKFRLAGEQDVDFAQAHYRKATARLRYLVGDDVQARSFITLAWAKREHVTRRDRLAIEGFRALIYRELGKAQETYRELRSRYPGDREQAYYAGLAHSHGGQMEEAEAAFSTAISIDPRFIPGLTALANTTFLAGKLERARAVAAQGLEVNPVDPGLLDVSVNVNLFLGRLEEADQLIERGLVSRSDAALRLAAGNLLLLRGDIQAAMEQFLDLGSPFSLAMSEIYRGRINAGLSRLSDSSQLQIAAGNFNTAVVALWFTGLILDENGDPALAFQQLTKAINLAPDFPDTIAALGVLAARRGDTKRASLVLAGLRDWGAKVDESRWRRQALFLEGELALAQEDIDQALVLLAEARDLAGVRLLGGGLISDLPLLTDALARAQVAAGDLDAAGELFREITGMAADRLYWPWIWLGAHVSLAELAVRDGREEEAGRWAAVVRQYWGGAHDEKQPMVDEALARLDRILPGR